MVWPLSYSGRCKSHSLTVAFKKYNSSALSIKMSVLLYIPGLLVLLVRKRGFVVAAFHMATILTMQIVFGAPFLLSYPQSYLQNAFDLSRVFLYKWTVNWRFVDEDTFLSQAFAKSLLLGHVATLTFFGLTRWCKDDGGAWSVISRGLRRPNRPAGLAPVTANGDLNSIRCI